MRGMNDMDTTYCEKNCPATITEDLTAGEKILLCAVYAALAITVFSLATYSATQGLILNALYAV